MNREDLREALKDANLQAFLRVIREGESSQTDDAYRMMFGGELFDSFADHPRQKITKGGYTSTAAGAYQFLEKTWNGLVEQYQFQDFSPECQDEGAVALIAGRLALDHVIAGRLEDALPACGKEWASLPGSPYGQPTLTMERAVKTFLEYGGTLCEEMAENSPFVETISQEKPVAPLIPIIAGSLAELIPTLSKAFGGTEVSDRNLAAATAAVRVVKDAVGAVNEQEALTKIQNDPNALAKAKEAVTNNWFAITGEVSPGSIQFARQADQAMSQTPNGIRNSPAFWMAILMLPLAYMILASLLYPSIGGDWQPETRAAIIGSTISLILGSLTGYYFGSVTTKNRPA